VSEFSPRALLIRAIRAEVANDPRSLQQELGPSAIHSCARQVWHGYNKTEITNPDTDVLASFMGRWIHKGIEQALEHEDVFGDNFLKELAVRTGDLPGHIDLYIKDQLIIVDWKTSTKKSLKSDNFPSAQYIYQAQVYGYQAIHDKGLAVKNIFIVGVPRDGRLTDIVEHKMAYDEELALSGMKWLADIKALKTKPAPEKNAATFCKYFCSWYDPSALVGCPGLKGRY
jgi:hypothetical protein